MIVTEQAAEITRLRTLVDGIVPKWAAARDEADRLRADLTVARGALVEARYWWGAIRTEKEDIRTRAERAEVDLAAAREVMRKVADLIYSEADDPLQDAIDMARAFLERPGTD